MLSSNSMITSSEASELIPVVPVSPNMVAGLKLLEDAIIFFETVEHGQSSHVLSLLNVALTIAKML
jgi:hypothetical protein